MVSTNAHYIKVVRCNILLLFIIFFTFLCVCVYICVPKYIEREFQVQIWHRCCFTLYQLFGA